jgi:hypothetical protein
MAISAKVIVQQFVPIADFYVAPGRRVVQGTVISKQ